MEVRKLQLVKLFIKKGLSDKNINLLTKESELKVRSKPNSKKIHHALNGT